MNELQTFQSVVENTMTLWFIESEFFGMIVRPIDFVLFTGALTLIVDLFRLVVMRGLNDE